MKVRYVAGLLAAALVAVACGGDNKGSSSATTSPSGAATTSASGGGNLDPSHPYIYLISADFTGALQAATTAEVLGLKAAITDINAKGGIKGREVRLETQNDQND